MNDRPRKPRPGGARKPTAAHPAARSGMKPAHAAPSAPAPHPDFPCPVADRCGGCQLAHLAYAQQLQRKQALMEKLLEGLCPVAPIIGMENPLHYRGKVHAVLAEDRRGHVFSGVYAAGTHRVVPVERCLIEDPRADRIIRTIVEMIPRYKLRVYNENTHRGFLRHVLVRTASVTGQIMVILVATGKEFPGGRAFTAELLQRHPEITTVVLNVNTRETSMVLGRTDATLHGPGYLEDELCGKRFRISPQSFYQVNLRQTETLYRIALDLAGLTGQETLLDAYCGTGTIGLCAADRVKQLIGVELNADAVRNAKENARLNHVKNARFFCDDAGHFMVKMTEAGEKLDVLIMDPPRSGSDERFLSAALTARPDRIVYVSCGPESLARDLRILTAGGYRAVRAIPVDMFPFTEHVETVVSLSQQKPDDIVRVGIDLDELDITKAESKATYKEIQEYVLHESGLKVTPLYIAQVKAKFGIIERECYNHAKSEDAKQPVCPPEKEKAITAALKHFGMI